MSQADQSHGRVEKARQGLVNAEEAYLRAHSWDRVLIGDEWMWASAVPWGAGIANVIMKRSDAVAFQRRAEQLDAADAAKEKSNDPGR